MINIKEVRICNWVRFLEEVKLTIGHFTYAHQLGSSSDGEFYIECNPIPLTEESLVKFGWHKSHHGFMEKACDGFSMCWDEHGMDIAFDTQTIGHELTHIKYVHQLQNLFFALTGEELTIK